MVNINEAVMSVTEVSEGPFEVLRNPSWYQRNDPRFTHCVRNKKGHLVDIGTQEQCLRWVDSLNLRYTAWLMARGTAAEKHV